MKKLFPILLAVLLLTACGKEEAEQTTVPTTATPTTQTVTPATEDTGPEGVLENKDTQTVYLLTRMSVLDDMGDESWYREYEYNDKGQKTEEFEYASTGDLSYRQVFTYDEAGLCTVTETHQMAPYDSSKLASVLTINYTYDDRGRVILQEAYEEGVLVNYDEFTYDDHGNILSQHNEFGEDQLDLTYEYTYDSQGNMLSCKEYQNGELMGTTEQTFDAENRLATSAYFDAGGMLMNRSEYVWEETTETETHYDMDGNVITSVVTTYDENGCITFQENQYSDGTVTMTEYFYEPFEIMK